MATNDTEKSLTARQVAALVALTAGTGSVAEAARAAGVIPGTVYRWLREPAFIAELRRIQADALRHTARRLNALGDSATSAVERGLSADVPISQQLRAAEIVFDRGPAMLELADLIGRITDIERRLNDAEPTGAR